MLCTFSNNESYIDTASQMGDKKITLSINGTETTFNIQEKYRYVIAFDVEGKTIDVCTGFSTEGTPINRETVKSFLDDKPS